MQVDPKLIKNQFEKSLETYSENAIVQHIMAQKLVKELSKIKLEFNNILELGSGTGLLTKEIIQKLSFNKYFANDLVAKSHVYIKEIIPDAVFYQGNAQRIKPSQKMDLIISNAMFQWFSNLQKISGYYETLLEKDGILAFSTFTAGNYKEIKDLIGISLEYKSYQEIKEIFSNDFEILYSEEFTNVLNFETPLQLLAHMKHTGVNSLISNHWTFKEVRDFCEKYKEKYPDITLTYSPAIFICKR